MCGNVARRDVLIGKLLVVSVLDTLLQLALRAELLAAPESVALLVLFSHLCRVSLSCILHHWFLYTLVLFSKRCSAKGP